MSKLKYSILALVSAAAICGATTAAAAPGTFLLWNGTSWVNNGQVTFTGRTTASYLQLQLPCDQATFVVDVVNGNAKVSAATFAGSSACTKIVAQNLPWAMVPDTVYTGSNPPFPGAPTLNGPLYGVTISGIRIYLPLPLNVTCPNATGSGSISGALDSSFPANRFAFQGALGPCGVQTQAGYYLSSSVPVTVI
ncbi:hypothetical protein SAMN04487939_106220 [Lysobacter sp. yr284]|uniref:hypothetical protein n=1 Tax=Lysobacter TaxID=68 RepID=UPI000896A2BE|nr:hypothetical protein [Lysobacter sp. yr284]SDY81368.1 hypothetical protein SAMN04487939_106220 [Lysobacter sp. yr284]